MKVTGLDKLSKLIKKLDGLDAFIIAQTDRIIGKDKRVLEDDNRKQLSFAGIGSDGLQLTYMGYRVSPLDPEQIYTAQYSKYKNKKGGQTSFVDLRLTGEFHRSILLIQENPGRWKFVSESVEKFGWLTNMYGDNILGVTEDFLQEFSDEKIQPQLQTSVEKYLT